jgi:hypothetical protein
MEKEIPTYQNGKTREQLLSEFRSIRDRLEKSRIIAYLNNGKHKVPVTINSVGEIGEFLHS